jgi:hypothetical protein
LAVAGTSSSTRTSSMSWCDLNVTPENERFPIV